ncbi:hypothetical protein PC9H_011651 [Pleurotus ostreatus]|uniref:Uncharacterized protein n=2 Tax=Pleurotus ostreatus TaxID=5322 RepID=A0A067N6W6_PLEO1|nr:uncharacterized protein PC9H_011651 [Pleurotus ostreatus]KAF7421131.1 hypothetical protein PC9H_011651 [Pleurotus ostreatus]KDQ23763.1 hypothetical protein PLEOSDRAFT_171015 [Pleurotus ostreatus PC15]
MDKYNGDHFSKPITGGNNGGRNNHTRTFYAAKEDMTSTLEMYEAMVDHVEDGVAWRALGELETMNDKLQKARRANEYLQRKVAEKFGFPHINRGRMFASDK